MVKKSLCFLFWASRVVRETILLCSERGRSEYGGGVEVGGEWIGASKESTRVNPCLLEIKKEDFMTSSCCCCCLSSPASYKKKGKDPGKPVRFHPTTSYIPEPTTLSWTLFLLLFPHLQSLQLHYLSFISVFSPCHPIWEPKSASTVKRCPRVTLRTHNKENLQSVETEKPEQVYLLTLKSFQKTSKTFL